jgi:cytochrome b subunit of formate dehydrogenase
MKHIKQYVTRSDSVESPETGFFNAGRKMQFWEIVWGCVAYVITGVIMWFPEIFGRILVAISYVIHDITWYRAVTGRDPQDALKQAEAEMAARERGKGPATSEPVL